jgi:hypothetical protein
MCRERRASADRSRSERVAAGAGRGLRMAEFAPDMCRKRRQTIAAKRFTR